MNQTTRMSMSIIQELTMTIRKIEEQKNMLIQCANFLAECLDRNHDPEVHKVAKEALAKYREVKEKIK